MVEGRWTDLLLLREAVQLVDITSLHVVIPQRGSNAIREDFPPGSASDFAGPDTLIRELRIHKAVLDLMRPNGARYSFPIAELDVNSFHKGQANTYAVDMENAKPWGRIQARGDFGPFDAQSLVSTPLSGSFMFTSVRLSDIGEIGGTLSSSGRFSGSLSSAETSARSETPDFEVAGGRPTPVKADIQCNVNGITGDVVIHNIALTTGRTTVFASGSVQGSPKVTNLDFELPSGRTQDTLRPFMKRPVPVRHSATSWSCVPRASSAGSQISPASKNGRRFRRSSRAIYRSADRKEPHGVQRARSSDKDRPERGRSAIRS